MSKPFGYYVEFENTRTGEVFGPYPTPKSGPKREAALAHLDTECRRILGVPWGNFAGIGTEWKLNFCNGRAKGNAVEILEDHTIIDLGRRG